MDLLAGYGSGSDSEEVAGGEPSRDGAQQNSAGNAGDSRRGAPRAFAATLAPRDGSKKVVQFHLPRPAGASEPAEGAEDEEDEDHIDDEELAQLRRAKRQQRTARLPDAGSSGVNNSNTGGQGGLFARLPAPKGQVPSLPAKGVAEAHQQPPLDDGAGEPAAEEEQEDGAAQRAPGGRSNFFGIGPAAATTRAVEATAAGDDAEGAVQGPARAEGGAGGYAGDLPGYQESASYYSYYNDSHGLPTASQDQQQYEAAWQAYYAQQQQQQQQALLQELVPGGGRKGRSREEIPTNLVEVGRSDVMKDQHLYARGQANATGVAFKDSRLDTQQSINAPKPNHLLKRKHQIGSLYYEYKKAELDNLEKRLGRVKSKTETQAKYGWS